MNQILELNRKIDYLEDTLACMRGENAALKAELAQLSHNKQSTQWPRLHDIKVAVKPRSAANGSDLHDATVWYMAVKDTYLWLCSHLGHNAH